MARRNQIVEHLESVPLFSSCTKRERAAIARHTEQVELAPETVVISEGDVGDAFYVVLEGEAELLRGGGSLGTIGPGHWFGELALLDSAPRNATVVARDRLVLAVLGARMFAVLLKEMPNMSDKLLRGLARRLREADAGRVQ